MAKGNILIVDDNSANLRLLSQMLSLYGYKARAVSSGQHALKSAEASPPDLILLDIMMPEMNGYEVCRRLKADAPTHDIPVIFVSALDEAFDKVKAFSVGGVDYVSKPFQEEEVLARIETHLALRNSQKRLEEQNARLHRANDELAREIAERRRAEEELRKHRDHLGELVEERTAELRAANEQLLRANDELAREIAERVRTQDEIKRRLEVERTLATISVRLMQATDIDRAISSTLADIGRLFGFKQVLLSCFGSGRSQTPDMHEWCAPDLAPTPPEVGNIPMTGIRYAFPIHAGPEVVGFLGCHGAETMAPELEETGEILEVVAGLLSNALQRATALETLQQQVADHTQALTTFFDLSILASELQGIQDILEPAITKILEVVSCEAICVHLLDQGGKLLQLVTQRGIPDVGQPQMQTVPLQSAFAEWMGQRNDPILRSDLIAAQDVPAALRGAGFHTYLGVQLQAKREPLGLLSCFRDSGWGFSLEEISLLVAIAKLLGIAVENSRLRCQVETLAVLEERQRLARDLHDSVTQSLYSLTLLAQAGQKLAKAGKLDRMMHYLDGLSTAAHQALKEMRLMIYELRPSALEGEGLVGALQRRLEAVEQRAGIRVQLAVEDTFVELPGPVEDELYHIVQEALNNALKHANATTLTVHLRADGEALELAVVDNGEGFDLQAVKGTGMGLANIRDRVGRLGGALNIVSIPGQGTQLTVRISVKEQLNG